MSVRILILVLLCACVAAVPPTLASADDYFAGRIQGQDHSRLLIQREPKSLVQAIYRVRSHCRLKGHSVGSESGSTEIRDLKVRSKRFLRDRRITWPSNGLEGPKHKYRTFFRGRIFNRSVKVELEEAYVDRHQGLRKCKSGHQVGTLRKVSRARYLSLLAETPFGPR